MHRPDDVRKPAIERKWTAANRSRGTSPQRRDRWRIRYCQYLPQFQPERRRRELLLGRKPPPAGNAGNDFHLRKRLAHRRMPLGGARWQREGRKSPNQSKSRRVARWHIAADESRTPVAHDTGLRLRPCRHHEPELHPRSPGALREAL